MNELNEDHPFMEIVIASHNVHKIREIKAILHPLKHIDIISLLDFPDYVPCEETKQTIKENAVLKATTAAKTLNRIAIADDSGLIVPALNGKPGVYSSRFAGNNATDKENRTKLLEEMEHLSEGDRDAYFECWVALAAPHNLIKSVCGICEGRILIKQKGGGGFGYDPLFVKHEYNKTFAELEDFVKNRISHRRKALDKILPTLENLST